MMNKYLLHLLVLVSMVFADQAVEIKLNQPGKIVIAVEIDTAWVSKSDNVIRTIPNLDSYFEPGLPMMPIFKDVLIGVPENATINIFNDEMELLGAYNPIINAPNKMKGADEDSPVIIPPEHHFDGYFPRRIANLSKTMQLNGSPASIIEIFPFKIQNRQLYFSKNISIEITWNTQNNISSAKVLSKTPYQEIKSRRSLKKSVVNEIPDYQYSNNLTRIVVDTSAWYKISGSDLASNGINISNVNPNTIRGWHQGEEIPLYLEAGNDGKFDNDDVIVFYGKRNPAPIGADYDFNVYTKENAYWFTWGAESGSRFGVKNVAPTRPASEVHVPEYFIDTLKVERNITYTKLDFNNDQQYLFNEWDMFDHFYMATRNVGGNPGKTKTLKFNLWDPVNSNEDGFKFELYGVGLTYREHNLNLNLNGTDLFVATWSGQTSYYANNYDSESFSNNILINGVNSLKLNLLDEFGATQANWLKFLYPRYFNAVADYLKFQSTDNQSTIAEFNINNLTTNDILLFKGKNQILTNLTFVKNQDNIYTAFFQDDASNSEYEIISRSNLIPVKKITLEQPIKSNLGDIQNNYVVITVDSFNTILDPLVDLRNGIAVDVENIYRQYSDGVISPHAIKDFLSDLYFNGNLEYALITMEPNGGIPAMHIFVYNWGELTSDYWYSLLDGDDYLPEIAVGRFPAATSSELQKMVDKTMYHETRGSETWDNNSLLISGSSPSFTVQSEQLANNISNSGSFLSRVYVATDTLSNFYFHETDTLLSHFERGLSYVNFIGHGGAYVWSDSLILGKEDIENDRIRNGKKLPFITSMTCYTGYMNGLKPNDRRANLPLGRYMVSSQYGGAIGWFGSAGPGWEREDFELVIPLQKSLFSDEDLTVGELINQAKINFYLNSHQGNIPTSQLFQFNLIGDPALRLKKPYSSNVSFTPKDPEPGEELTITSDVSQADSIYYQLYLPDNYSLNQPSYLGDSFPKEITLADSLEKGFHKLNVSHITNNSLYNSSESILLKGSFINIQSIIPTVLTNCDSIDIIAEVIDRNGISAVQLLVNGEYWGDLTNTSGDMYSLSNLIPPKPVGSDLNFICRVIDATGDTTISEEVFATVHDIPVITPLQGTFEVDEQISVLVGIESENETLIDVVVELYVNKNDLWELVGKDTVAFDGLSQKEAQINGYYPYGINTYKAVTIVDFTCSPTDDNTTTFDLETSAFWVTPELGTTDDGITHSKVGIKNIDIDILAGNVSESRIMQISSIDEIEIPAQPEFTTLQTDREYPGISVDWASENDYQINWSIGKSDVQFNNRFYQYFEDSRIWLPIDYAVISDSIIVIDAFGSGKFTYLANTDVEKPTFTTATINGQKFLNNIYLNTSPQIQFSVYDKNGLDFRSDSIKYFLNHNVTSNLSQEVSGTGNNLNISLSPTLSVTDSLLSIVIQDAAENESDTLKLSFIVSDHLDLIDYGNFPNPFANTTTLTYDLTETVDEVKIDIFTIKGRKIKSFDQNLSVSDADMIIGGFHEITWDGLDESGNKVSNGVYYYSIQAKKGKSKIERIGKMVVSR